jgi:hypothetical protein
MRPGTTKTYALTTGYQRLATMYDESFTDVIKSADDAEVANNVLISVITQAAELAFGTSMPVVAGHPLAAGDGYTFTNQEYIKRAWLRGTSGAILIITPTYE